MGRVYSLDPGPHEEQGLAWTPESWKGTEHPMPPPQSQANLGDRGPGTPKPGFLTIPPSCVQGRQARGQAVPTWDSSRSLKARRREGPERRGGEERRGGVQREAGRDQEREARRNGQQSGKGGGGGGEAEAAGAVQGRCWEAASPRDKGLRQRRGLQGEEGSRPAEPLPPTPTPS